MNLALTDAEVAALCRALDNYLAMLTSEAARSEDREVEIDLWQLNRYARVEALTLLKHSHAQGIMPLE